MSAEKVHQAVMVGEVVENLGLEPGDTILDATVGGGGHAEAILPNIMPGGRLIGIDQDNEAVGLAQEALIAYKDSATLVNANFRNLDLVLRDLKIEKVSGVLFDLGISSYQLEGGSERGFAIDLDERLDMRMDRRNNINAFDVVNRMNVKDLADLIFEFGEEHFARRIARAILAERSRSPIKTTKELARIVARCVPAGRRSRRIHPATKTFQAIRIYVNDELGALEEGLRKAIEHLEPGARVCVISFHSLEDRIVKKALREFRDSNILRTVSKKPIRPSSDEIGRNPRSRSAKLRVAERTGL